MSTIEEAAVSLVKADAGIGALAGDDIFPKRMPAGQTTDCIVYQVISAPEAGMWGYVRPRIQFTCWGTTYAKAVALANALRDCFYNQHLTVLGVHLRCWVANVMDGEDDEVTGRYARIVDVRFDYRH